MKRFLFSTLFFSLMLVGAQAQSSNCSKKCTSKQASSKSCQGKSASATADAGTATIEAAAKLASMDESIESKTCPVSGKVSYSKKETSANGEVSYVDVNYDAETNTFVNASPMKVEETKACSGKKAKGCCSSKSAKSASADSKGCCSKKSAAKSTSTSVSEEKSEAKPTKG